MTTQILIFFLGLLLKLSTGSSFKLALVPFNMLPSFFWVLLCFLVHFIFFLPKPWNQPLSKSPVSFYFRIVFRNQDLATGSAHHYWGIIVSMCSEQTGRKYMNLYTYTHLYFITYVNMLKIMDLYWHTNSSLLMQASF